MPPLGSSVLVQPADRYPMFRRFLVPIALLVPTLPPFHESLISFSRRQPVQHDRNRVRRSRLSLNNPSADTDGFRQIDSTVDVTNEHDCTPCRSPFALRCAIPRFVEYRQAL